MTESSMGGQSSRSETPSLETTWFTCAFCRGPLTTDRPFCSAACREEAHRDRPDDEYQLLYVLAVVEGRSVRDCAARIPHLKREAVRCRLNERGWNDGKPKAAGEPAATRWEASRDETLRSLGHLLEEGER